MLGGRIMKTILFIILSFVFINNSFAQDQSEPELYIFVGEKIFVTEIEEPGVVSESNEEITFSMDYVFKAKYKILENISGDLKLDTIVFIAYDHYGTAEFSKYKYVLLYVTKHHGEFYHEKYQFSALYKTKDNKWAGTYAVADYNHSFNINTTVKPIKIDFEPEVSIDIKKYDDETIKEWFPEPYFKIKGKKAIAVYGNYIPELIQLKKDGVLKARGHSLK
jgi:hypothetical protein